MPDPTILADELRTAAFSHASSPGVPGPSDRDVHVDQQATRAAAWPNHVGRRFADARIDQLQGTLAQVASGWDGTSNVLLLGNVGVGKTHAAAAMAYRSHVEHGRTLIFRSAPLLLDGMRPGRDGSEQSRDRAIRVDLLVIDDLGSEKTSDWTGEQLGIVVDERYRDCRPTIVTSNLGPDRLRESIGERAWSRLYEGAVRHTIGGDDRRVA